MGASVFCLGGGQLGDFLFFSPVLEYSLFLAIYFSLDFGKTFP